MELLDQPVTLVLLGIIFLFGGLGVFKLLRPSSDRSRNQGEQGDEDV